MFVKKYTLPNGSHCLFFFVVWWVGLLDGWTKTEFSSEDGVFMQAWKYISDLFDGISRHPGGKYRLEMGRGTAEFMLGLGLLSWEP